MQLCSHLRSGFTALPPICNLLVYRGLLARKGRSEEPGEGMRQRLRLSVRLRLTGLHFGHQG